jgi:polysaccharide deacetylase 2 family uncharacterized protein YibQ
VWWIVLVGSIALVVSGYLSGRTIGTVSASVRHVASQIAPEAEQLVVPLERMAHGAHSLVPLDDTEADRERVAAVARPHDAPRDLPDRGRLAIVVLDAGNSPELDAATAAIPIPLTFAVQPTADAGDVHALRDAGRSVVIDVPHAPADVHAADAIVAAVERFHASGVALGTFVDDAFDRALMRTLARRDDFAIDAVPDGESGWYNLARNDRMRRLTRDLALDVRDDRRYQAYLVHEAIGLAHRTGRAVAIVHESTDALRLLATVPELADRANVDVVPASELAYR